MDAETHILSARWLTPPDPAAIGMLACSPAAAEKLASRTLPESGRARFMAIQDANGEAVDEVIAMHEGERVVLSVHGGPGVRAAVDAACAALGIMMTEGSHAHSRAHQRAQSESKSEKAPLAGICWRDVRIRLGCVGCWRIRMPLKCHRHCGTVRLWWPWLDR